MLKKTLFAITFLLFSTICIAQSKDKGLTINITGLRNNNGKVLISVFKSADGFPATTSNAIKRGEASIQRNVAHFSYPDLPNGTYAIAVLHDENGNLKMDKTGLGLPKEGYGFSQNVMGVFGPPSFKKASINIPAEPTVTIKMKY